MGSRPKAGGGGSMISIMFTIFIVAGIAVYFLNPTLFQNIVATVAHWFRLGR
jgi:hypothetical protein